MFTGIQIIEPEIFKRIPEGQFCGTTENIFPTMIQDNVPVYGYLYNGYWKDMGNRESYLQVNADALDEKVFLKGVAPNELNNSLIIPPVLVDRNCQIAENSQIGPYTVIGPNCIIKNGAVVENSILWEGVTIGAGSTVKGSVIAKNRTIGDGKNINDEAVI
jgi:NDP-sugar pyrophosphorylase family protein